MDKIKYNCLNRITPKDDVKNTLKNNEKPIKQLFNDELNKVKRIKNEELKIKIKEYGKINRVSSELCDLLVKKICEYQTK